MYSKHKWQQSYIYMNSHVHVQSLFINLTVYEICYHQYYYSTFYAPVCHLLLNKYTWNIKHIASEFIWTVKYVSLDQYFCRSTINPFLVRVKWSQQLSVTHSRCWPEHARESCWLRAYESASVPHNFIQILTHKAKLKAIF